MTENSDESQESTEMDIFEETQENGEKTRKRPGKQAIKVVGGEKQGMKETIKKVIIAKAVEAAKNEWEVMPELEKEHGVRETGTREKEGAGQREIDGQKTIELSFLPAGKEGFFIGRKKSVTEKYGLEAALYLGRIQEDPFKEKPVFLDGLNPHVVFVCGSRGSGKSYLLGVLAEELALKNRNVSVVVIDPVGVFWSMRFPNKDEKELEMLAKWNMLPQGLKNVRVFIPEGVKDKVPKATFDATFSLQPSLLTTDDWCLTFGIDRFSPTGLLLEKALQKVRQAYKTLDGKTVKGKQERFSLEDLIQCLKNDSELNSTERGYKPDSVRALISRFDAAKAWGIFSETGTPLGEICGENQLTIIDTSFLEENVGALVIGIIARRTLAARKISTRKEAAQKLKETSLDELLESEIPPTWLFIDEAHTLIPSGNIRTPASNSLVEYVKQGRQPGCSLVFATQQPSAIDSRVLSQLDIIFSHKLVFDDDIKSVYKRTPTVIPRNFRQATFIKTLPVGVSMVGDRMEETTRAFVMKTRPRMSQHEGREAVTIETKRDLDEKQVRKLATEMAFAELERNPALEEAKVYEIVKRLNEKYSSNTSPLDVVNALEKKGAVIDPKRSMLILPGEQPESEIIEHVPVEAGEIVEEEARTVLHEKTNLKAFSARIDESTALRIFNMQRKKKFLGLFGVEERIENVSLKYLQIYRVQFNYFNMENVFNQGEAFIDSYTGEFMQFDLQNETFLESKGLKDISGLGEVEVKALLAIGNRKMEGDALKKKLGEPDARASRAIKRLLESNLVGVETVSGTSFYFVKKVFDLPPNPLHPFLSSLGKVSLTEVESLSLQKNVVEKATVITNLKKLWKKLVVTGIKETYLPFYECILKKPNGSTKRIWIEALTGKEMSFIK